jgi:PAS domain
MTSFSKRDAERLVAGLILRPASRTLVEYWLSLWAGDALPRRETLRPARMKRYLPNVLLFDVVPEKSVTVRLAGTQIVHAIKTELTGRDWVAMAPPSYRAERLRVFTALARGAIGVGHRRIPTTFNQHYNSEEVLLPFAPEAGGVSPVMCHLDGDADRHAEVYPVSEAIGKPLNFGLHALPRHTLAA